MNTILFVYLISTLLLLQALKTKQKVTDQKLQQAEENYSQSKQLYDEITDELYEELPTFFDRWVKVVFVIDDHYLIMFITKIPFTIIFSLL